MRIFNWISLKKNSLIFFVWDQINNPVLTHEFSRKSCSYENVIFRGNKMKCDMLSIKFPMRNRKKNKTRQKKFMKITKTQIAEKKSYNNQYFSSYAIHKKIIV